MISVGTGGHSAQSLPGSLLVVFAPPGLHDRTGMENAGEPMLVQAFVTQAAIERFDVGVLIWLARVDQAQLQALLVSPGHHGLAAKLLAVVPTEGFKFRPFPASMRIAKHSKEARNDRTSSE